MESRAALAFDVSSKWDVVDVDVDEPREREVPVRYVAVGLCDSDDHITKGDMPFGNFPCRGGH
jgi:Zn-dependent alcohol dehydrogenase